MLVTVEDPAAGTLKLAGNPLKILGLSRSADARSRAPSSTPTARRS